MQLLAIPLVLIVIWRFGFSWETIFALIFSGGVLLLAIIDLQQQLLPDQLTLPLLWLGLLLSMGNWFCTSEQAILGACAGYLSLWSLAKLFLLVTGKHGMGHGDFKLFAMLGAWFGWQALFFILLLASVSASLVGSFLWLKKKIQRDTPIPFGPFLVGAGWIYLLCKI